MWLEVRGLDSGESQTNLINPYYLGLSPTVGLNDPFSLLSARKRAETWCACYFYRLAKATYHHTVNLISPFKLN